MANTEAIPSAADHGTSVCPLCGAPMDDPRACSQCDWRESEHPLAVPSGRRDLIAALLSVPVPGLGHVYKGHPGTGVLFLVGMAAVSAIAVLFTMFFGWLLIPLYWAFAIFQAYCAEDYAPKPEDIWLNLILMMFAAAVGASLTLWGLIRAFQAMS